MKIYKLGGNVLKDKSTRNSIYKQLKNQNEKMILVVSAIKETPFSTDNLLSLLENNDDYYIQERLQTTGELISSFIICNELKNLYVNCDVLFPEEIGIIVEKEGNQIHNYQFDASILEAKLQQCNILICPGFTAIDQNQKIVSLNRGGSDLTAILIAKMTNTPEVTYFKDVPGVGICDPKYYTNHKIYSNVSYDKMILFSKHGANILQLEAIKKAKEYDIQMHIQHYALQNQGTLIHHKKGDSCLGINILENKVYMDGFSNANLIKKILFENDLKYDLIISMDESIEITTNYQNEKDILKVICSSLLRS